MTDEYEYILEKIMKAEFINIPFPHLDIKDFLSNKHLDLILNDKQIHFEVMNNHDELKDKLIDNGWDIQKFPGCITNWDDYKKYLNSLEDGTKKDIHNVGVTFRLNRYKNKKVEELINFMNSDRFHNTLKKKFNIKEKTTIISAIQKNLNGYEISPHPDVRAKCLTYLLNVNNKEIEELDCHTHLLEFKNQYKYIQEEWRNNQEKERHWVKWDYCNTIKTMNKNNSMVLFHPADDPPTLHAIRLKYDHLKYQRTQIYGNLMYVK